MIYASSDSIIMGNVQTRCSQQKAKNSLVLWLNPKDYKNLIENLLV